MVNCSVPLCASRKDKNAKSIGISFCEYPSNIELRESWIKAVSRKDPCTNGYWIPKCYDVVCSLHFPPESFKHTPKRKFLKPGTIPTIFPGQPIYIKTLNNLLTKRRHILRKYDEIPSSSLDLKLKLGTETEETICNENLLFKDLAEVHRNQMIDINTKCPKSVPSVSSTVAGMKSKQLKTDDMQTENNSATVHIVRVSKQIPSSPHKAIEPEDTSVLVAEMTICNEDLAEVHNNHTLDINSKCANSVSNISSTTTAMKYKQLKTRYETASRKIRRLNAKMRKLEVELQDLRNTNKSLSNRISQYNIGYLEESIKNKDNKALFLKDQLSSLIKKNVFWSDCTIKNTILLRSKSPAAYHFLREMNILSLPSINTLNRHIGNYNTELIDSSL